MSSPLQIKLSQSASAQIEEAAAWWAQNRPSAPGAIREDLDRILGLLSVHPGIGTRARRPGLKGLRRITLSRIRYDLYYRVSDDAVEVLAFWHTSRGSPPPL
ncbi:MAG: type II toxin-antitoxin system RelE/ParE family toxin [Burkholderiales bacterium]